jgi:DNA-binding GntR family transcriptional regulator
MPMEADTPAMDVIERVYQDIRDKIERGAYGYSRGAKLASITSTAKRYNVSAWAAERALRRLGEDKFVEPRKGQGYYVCYVKPRTDPTG